MKLYAALIVLSIEIIAFILLIRPVKAKFRYHGKYPRWTMHNVGSMPKIIRL